MSLNSLVQPVIHPIDGMRLALAKRKKAKSESTNEKKIYCSGCNEPIEEHFIGINPEDRRTYHLRSGCEPTVLIDGNRYGVCGAYSRNSLR